MLTLEKYKELMTKEEVAEVLRCKPVTVPRLIGLRKAYICNGRKHFLYRKQDVIDYINSKTEKEEVKRIEVFQEKRYRKVGIPTLLSKKELQEKCF